MSVRKFVNVLLVTAAPLVLGALSTSANADCPTWSTTCTVDPVYIYGTSPPPDPYDPYEGLFPGTGGGGGGPTITDLANVAANGFKTPCVYPGETQNIYASRAVALCTAKVYDALPAVLNAYNVRGQAAQQVCEARRADFIEKYANGQLETCS